MHLNARAKAASERCQAGMRARRNDFPYFRFVTENVPAASMRSRKSAGRRRRPAINHGLSGRVTPKVAERRLDAVGRPQGLTSFRCSRTGPGYVAARAGERGAELIGVDFSDTMLCYERAYVAGRRVRAWRR